jgi:transcriptional regulator with XRE-family HTH domain
MSEQHPNTVRSIGAAIEHRRAQTGQSDEDAARLIGVTQSNFSRWRRGLVVPTDKWHAPLAQWLQMTTSEVALLAQISRSDPRDELQRNLAPLMEVPKRIDELRDRLDRLEARLDQADD